jgi:hypothetical protein
LRYSLDYVNRLLAESATFIEDSMSCILGKHIVLDVFDTCRVAEDTFGTDRGIVLWAVVTKPGVGARRGAVPIIISDRVSHAVDGSRDHFE